MTTLYVYAGKHCWPSVGGVRGFAIRVVVLLFTLGAGAMHGSLAADLDPFSTRALVAPSQVGTMAMPGEKAPCSLASLDKNPLSLADVVERALCNNPQTREAWANALVDSAQVGVNRSAYLPSLSASASVSRNRTSGGSAVSGDGSTSYTQRNAGLVLSYLLYDFGGRDAALENARQVLIAANASQDATVQSVFLSAVQAYYQLFASQVAAQAAAESERSSREAFDAAQARYTVGAATPADKLQAQTAFSQAVLNRIQAEGNERTAQGTLANVMGLDANQPLNIAPPGVPVPEPSFERDLNRLIADARNRRPDLAAAEAQIKAARANVEAAKASGKPSLSLSSNVNYSNSTISDPFHSAALGLSVSIPLFTGFETTYRIRAAEAQVDTRIAQRDLLAQQVALDVWKAYQNLTTATQAVQSSADLLASATQSERVALGRYKAGVGSILDLLSAQAALASARQQDVQARYNWYIAKATLAQAMGQLDFSTIGPVATRSTSSENDTK
jgi:outer membrane protein